MNSLSHHITKLLVVIAAIAAVGGGTAVAAKLITGKQIKNGTVTGKDLKSGAVGAKHLSAQAAASFEGAQGEAGPAGPKGERGPSAARAVHTDAGKSFQADEVVQSVVVPDGAYVLQAKAVLLNIGKPTEADCRLGVLRGLQFEALDQIDDVNLTENGTDADTLAVSLMAATKVDNGSNTVELRCAPDADRSLNARDRGIVATQVAELE